jgi:hypothetical protein
MQLHARQIDNIHAEELTLGILPTSYGCFIYDAVAMRTSASAAFWGEYWRLRLFRQRCITIKWCLLGRRRRLHAALSPQIRRCRLRQVIKLWTWSTAGVDSIMADQLDAGLFSGWFRLNLFVNGAVYSGFSCRLSIAISDLAYSAAVSRSWPQSCRHH